MILSEKPSECNKIWNEYLSKNVIIYRTFQTFRIFSNFQRGRMRWWAVYNMTCQRQCDEKALRWLEIAVHTVTVQLLRLFGVKLKVKSRRVCECVTWKFVRKPVVMARCRLICLFNYICICIISESLIYLKIYCESLFYIFFLS